MFGYQVLGFGFDTGFVPTDEPGVLLWLDADDATTFTKDASDLISQWDDKSGNGNDVTQASGALQPTFKINIQNNKSVVDFDGGDFLTGGDFETFGAGGQTVFVVGQTRSTAFQVYVAKFFSGGSGTFFVAQSDENLIYATNGGSGRVDDVTNAPWLINNTQLMTCKFDNSFLSTYRNSVLLSGSVVQTSPLRINDLDVTVGSTSAGSLKLTGFISEIIIYDSALSNRARVRVQNYLNNKWNIF